LPFDDSSVSFIFAEHVFEHFSPATATVFLAECRRTLRSGGVLRIIVPDAGMYLSHYRDGWDEIAEARPLIRTNGAYKDRLGRSYRTKMEFINEVFRQGVEHKYAYDDETLMMKLHDAGFTQVIRQSFGLSAAGKPPLDTPERRGDSLYLEAI